MLQIKSHWDEGTHAPRPNLALIYLLGCQGSLPILRSQHLGAEGGAGAGGWTKHKFKKSVSGQPELHSELDSCHSKAEGGGMSPKELQVSSGQRDKGGRKRPRTTDSKVVKPVRASGAGTPEDGIEAARLPTTQPSLFMSRSGEGHACHSSFCLRENTKGTKS